MTEPALLSQEFGAILQLTLNRPDKHNAMNEEIFRGLQQGLETFIARRDLRVMLIRAQGKYFSAGADLAEKPVPDMHGSSAAVRTWYRRELNGMLALYQELEATEKPIVVAHHATCIGGGLELSLSCDLRLASRHRRCKPPHASRRPSLGALDDHGQSANRCRAGTGHRSRARGLSGQRVRRQGHGVLRASLQAAA